MSTVILSCTTLLEYVQQAQKTCYTDFPIIELNRQYHIEPSKMKEHILQTLSSLPSDVDTVLVAMGFCGGSWQDVSCSKTLVIPRVADCVALALTTPEQYAPDLKEPGHMYLFGNGENGFSIQAIYESLLKEYDKEMADIVFNMYFENYYHLDIIDNVCTTVMIWIMWNVHRKMPTGFMLNWILYPEVIFFWKSWYLDTGIISF